MVEEEKDSSLPEIEKELVQKEEDIHKKFHDRIKRLLINAGFDILKSDYNTMGADIIAQVDNKKIIVQCKCAQSENKEGLGISHLIDEYSKKAEKENAERAILAISKYKISPTYFSEEEKERRAKFDKVIIWDDQIINYYEEVVSALNEWAKYTIIGDMYITSKFGGPISAPFIKIQQGDFEFLVFKITPEDLLKISYIFRRDYSRKAYQRTLNISRLKKDISTFLDSPEAILPSNILGVFNSDIKTTRDNKILIPAQYKSFWIIDGQHRLYSFCYTKDKIRKQNFELICVGLDGKRWAESQQAKLFVDINSKSKRISKLLLLDLYELIGIKDIRVELVKKLSNESKTFKNKIKISRLENKPISLVTFSTTPPMNTLLNDRNGELGYFFRNKYGRYPDYNNNSLYEKCKDFYFNVFDNYFGKISEIFSDEWNNSDKYILATERGIRMLLRLLRWIIRYNTKNQKRFDDEENLIKIISAIKGFNFENEILKNKYLGEGGADNFVEDIKTYIQKTIPDFFQKENILFTKEKTIESADPDSANKILSNWIPELGNEIYGELSYIDESTFDYLKMFPNGAKINLMISAIKDESKCKEIVKKLREQKYLIEIKRATKAPPREGEPRAPYLHERWLAGNNCEIEFGTDLKKSSIGKRKHTLRFTKKQNSERMEEFIERWKGISKFREREILIENLFI